MNGKNRDRIDGKKKKTGKRLRFTDFLIGLVFLAGLCVMLYPMASDQINRFRTDRAVARYEQSVSGLSPEQIGELLKGAREYNLRLKENPDPWSEKGRTPGYRETLRANESGIMGYITIKKIRVHLPFYHGTEEDVLQTAVGHLEGSSLPVGDPGGHAVLSAHRGLPSAKLFTDLPELAAGDEFIVTVLGREMVYKVDQILTVLPDSSEALTCKTRCNPSRSGLSP